MFPNIGSAQTYREAFKHRGCPNMQGVSKHMGASKQTGAIQTYGASKHTVGASKHMEASKNTTGIQTYGGHPNIWEYPVKPVLPLVDNNQSIF